MFRLPDAVCPTLTSVDEAAVSSEMGPCSDAVPLAAKAAPVPLTK